MCVLLSGVVASWVALLYGHAFIGAVVAVFSTSRGCSRIMQGASREYGIAVERAAVLEMQRALAPQGYQIQTDLMTRWIGNIDSVVSPPWTKVSFVVEIKSFSGIIRRFYGLTKVDGHYRLSQPVHQVRQQCAALGSRWHFPVLWMPTSELQTAFLHNGVMVVNGDVSLLESALLWFDLRISVPAIIFFINMPPVNYRRYVKSLGFQYDGAKSQWYGQLTKERARYVATRIAGVGGSIHWRSRE